MDKETSSRVSTLAADILKMPRASDAEIVSHDIYNSLLADAKTLAGSALSQDETPGQQPSGIHPAPREFTDAQLADDPVLQFFHYAHLPERLQATSQSFFWLAHYCVNNLPRNAERSTALRKLLEAKEAAVRAKLGQNELRLASEPSNISYGLPNIGEPVEIGGHDEDRDGPIPFDG